jgi:ubiquinone/menaquinone biosynthesis C-methylase UbiE
MGNFDRVAWFYDKLARVVFGKAMYRAQTRFLEAIDNDSSVLVLGGGTGWLLTQLIRIRPRVRVVFIDTSKSMIERAKRAVGDGGNVTFIDGDEGKIPPESTFDAIITHFYLDLFDEASCANVCELIKNVSRPKSIWLACDFVEVAPWHRAFVRAMYLFFRLFAGVKMIKLPEWRMAVERTGFAIVDSASYFRGLIFSGKYQRHD